MKLFAKHCGQYCIPKINFWISKIDAVGFLVLSILLTGPVWFASYLVENSIFLAYLIAFVTIFVAYSEKQNNVVTILVAELLIDMALINSGFYSIGLMVVTAFALTFIRIGKKVYGFFFMCVNYQLKANYTCKVCNKDLFVLELPGEQKRIN